MGRRGPAEPPTAIVTCMDARLDACGFLDEWPSTVHVVRNAGGRVTGDALRSLAASCALGTRRVLVIHHTDCAMAAHSDERIRELLPTSASHTIDFLTIADPWKALLEDTEAVRRCDLLPPDIEVRAFVFDLAAKVAREAEI